MPDGRMRSKRLAKRSGSPTPFRRVLSGNRAQRTAALAGGRGGGGPRSVLCAGSTGSKKDGSYFPDSQPICAGHSARGIERGFRSAIYGLGGRRRLLLGQQFVGSHQE